jgi:hypothetical protein
VVEAECGDMKVSVDHSDIVIQEPPALPGVPFFFAVKHSSANSLEKCVVRRIRVVTIDTRNAEVNQYDE